jgi:HAD superfamily hydrolase (TIGR01509 family)
MIKAIIFDKDGVIINSEKMKAKAWGKALEKFGARGGLEWYEERAGLPRKDLCEMAVRDFSLSAEPEEISQMKQKFYSELTKNGVEPVASAVDLLRSIPKNKIKIGLASSDYRENIERELSMIGVYDLFDAITSGVDEVKKDKPHPEIYLVTAKKLETDPSECIVVEDSQAGVAAAKDAGMTCIGYQNPETKRQDLSKADIVIGDFSNLSLSDILDKF